ncbi:MinD/ParA family protein [Arthrobacter sp. RCC_34]|uniref:MinD/ParA family ATP-binding protein n=1 Tax=Arthrobacter sp. RCC_34 TaxID=3239230 RepID=UPI0035245A06
MAIDQSKIREFPPISITVNGDEGGELLIGASSTKVEGTEEEVMRQLMTLAINHAREGGAPIRVTTRDAEGIGVLLIDPSGEVEEAYSAPLDELLEPVPAGASTPKLSRSASHAAAPEAEPSRAAVDDTARVVKVKDVDELSQELERLGATPVDLSQNGGRPLNPLDLPPVPATPPTPAVSVEEPAVEAAAAPATRRDVRRSFLTEETVEEPASKGWRGFLTSLGIRMTPSATERAERADIYAVSQHWPGPRTIAVVNGRGGACKTMSTISLAAVFARYGGAGVLAEDNNQTRGTLGWRTEKAKHDASLLDLLPRIEHLLSPSAQASELANYVHHQTRDKYDVLRSRPELLASDQRFDADTVDAVQAVASKYYRLIIIDSGNDESDPMWLRMIHHADQLVIPTTTRRDSAESAALLLEALRTRGGKSAQLADSAVVLVSQENSSVPANVVEDLATGFREMGVRDVVKIPFDKAMKDGLLTYGALQPATQRAWLAAGAAVAKGL